MVAIPTLEEEDARRPSRFDTAVFPVQALFLAFQQIFG
jgi:hypothetical protein